MSDTGYLKMLNCYETNLCISQRDSPKTPEGNIQVPSKAISVPPDVLAQYLSILLFSNGKTYENRGEK